MFYVYIYIYWGDDQVTRCHFSFCHSFLNKNRRFSFGQTNRIRQSTYEMLGLMVDAFIICVRCYSHCNLYESYFGNMKPLPRFIEVENALENRFLILLADQHSNFPSQWFHTVDIWIYSFNSKQKILSEVIHCGANVLSLSILRWYIDLQAGSKCSPYKIIKLSN